MIGAVMFFKDLTRASNSRNASGRDRLAPLGEMGRHAHEPRTPRRHRSHGHLLPVWFPIQKGRPGAARRYHSEAKPANAIVVEMLSSTLLIRLQMERTDPVDAVPVDHPGGDRAGAARRYCGDARPRAGFRR
jgi:hypothetical protein